MKKEIEKVIRKIENTSSLEELSGIPSGFLKLDKITDGFQSSNLIVIGARPSMGKTSFLSSTIRNIAVDFNRKVLLFSLEMSTNQFINKMISSETGFPVEKLRRGNLEPYEWEQLNVKINPLLSAPIFIEDSPSLTIDEIINKAEKNITENFVEIIFIDYIQLIGLVKPQRQNREEELSIVTKKLKHLSKKHQIPVIITSQLNRSLETRGGSKRPLLFDFRDSGAIEDDSDIVMFLYRPEYYGITEWDDDLHLPCESQAELIIAKNRFGVKENIRLKFEEHITKFSNLEEFGDSEFITSMNASYSEDLIEPKDAFGADDVPF